MIRALAPSRAWSSGKAACSQFSVRGKRGYAGYRAGQGVASLPDTLRGKNLAWQDPDHRASKRQKHVLDIMILQPL
jgi:hypothetical protein